MLSTPLVCPYKVIFILFFFGEGNLSVDGEIKSIAFKAIAINQWIAISSTALHLAKTN